MTLLSLIMPYSQQGDMRLEDDSSANRDQTEFGDSNIAGSNTINLDQQTQDVTINRAGTYTVSGKFEHSIVIDAESADVELVLNGVEINNPNTATIVGLKAKKVTITTAKGTKNVLNDGGNSVYDGCIFSNAELVFRGEGTLEVNGKQNEGEGIATEAQNITFESGTYLVSSNDDGINAGGDGATITINGGDFYINAGGDGIDSNKNAVINGGTIFVVGSDTGGDAGIDTEDGFVINGGTLIALGSGMLETPLTSSKQTSLTFSLSNAVQEDVNVALLHDGQAVISFAAPKSFSTIVISTSALKAGEYQLSTGGEHTGKLVNGIYQGGVYNGGKLISVGNTEKFTIFAGKVNNFGNTGGRR